MFEGSARPHLVPIERQHDSQIPPQGGLFGNAPSGPSEPSPTKCSTRRSSRRPPPRDAAGAARCASGARFVSDGRTIRSVCVDDVDDVVTARSASNSFARKRDTSDPRATHATWKSSRKKMSRASPLGRNGSNTRLNHEQCLTDVSWWPIQMGACITTYLTVRTCSIPAPIAASESPNSTQTI